MKLLLVLSVFLAQSFASAEDGFVLKNTRPLKADKVDIVLAKGKCPNGATCTPASILTLSYTLYGCMDDISVQSTTEKMPEGKLRVYVSASNLTNAVSERVDCVRAKEATASITLGMGLWGMDRVEVIQLDEATKVDTF